MDGWFLHEKYNFVTLSYKLSLAKIPRWSRVWQKLRNLLIYNPLPNLQYFILAGSW